MKKVILFAMLLAAGVLAAETLKITQSAQMTPAKNITSDANGVLTFKGSCTSYSTRIFELDPTKKYTVSGDFRQIAGKKAAVLFFGFQPMDAQNRQILLPHTQIIPGTDTVAVLRPRLQSWMPHTQIIPGTDTVLTADVPKGAKEIRVKDASKWRKGYRFAINTDPSLKDLPNFNVIHNNSVTAVKDGDDWKVTFDSPIRIAIKKGTSVRQHGLGGTMYPAAPAVRLNGNWKTYKGSATGILKTYGYSYTKFPIGTKKVRMILFVNLGQKDAVTEVKNLTLSVE